jgi:hypothetical protein
MLGCIPDNFSHIQGRSEALRTFGGPSREVNMMINGSPQDFALCYLPSLSLLDESLIFSRWVKLRRFAQHQNLLDLRQIS